MSITQGINKEPLGDLFLCKVNQVYAPGNYEIPSTSLMQCVILLISRLWQSFQSKMETKGKWDYIWLEG